MKLEFKNQSPDNIDLDPPLAVGYDVEMARDVEECTVYGDKLRLQCGVVK